jgi:hypothetical protein
MELLAERVWLRCVVQAEGQVSPYKICDVDFGLGFESGQEQENVHTGCEAHRRMFSAPLPRGKVAGASNWPLYLSSVEVTVDWRNTSPPTHPPPGVHGLRLDSVTSNRLVKIYYNTMTLCSVVAGSNRL